jgi:SAM-dependent methyltransferase
MLCNSFRREDESNDALFYQQPRLVDHLDRTALETVETLIDSLVLEPSPDVLDLMASWDSHLPGSLNPARTVGLGLNAVELAFNERLDERVIHDLNSQPSLPFEDARFDVVINTVSVDYLTQPVRVFAEVGRILRPGGLFLVIFSNRWFERKVTRIWRSADEQQRVELVEQWFEQSGMFEQTRSYVSKGKPRPPQDKYTALGIPSDPIYAVFADREGMMPRRQRPLPTPAAGRSPEEIQRRKAAVKDTLCCPYCDASLRKWAVPQTPFTEWPNEFMYGCFNDSCPYLVEGWEEMGRQGNGGWSYRLVYNPLNDAVMPMPVPNLNAMKDNIIDG